MRTYFDIIQLPDQSIDVLHSRNFEFWHSGGCMRTVELKGMKVKERDREEVVARAGLG